MSSSLVKPLRLLVVLPSWVGDVVMATPALRRLRDTLRGSFIGGLCRPGIEELLAGGDLFDELHIERGGGVFGPKFLAAKVRPRRYDTALLLTNSFATALTTRIAGIPRRVGFNRDSRGFLLTDKLIVPRRTDGAWAIIPTCQYYWDAAAYLLEGRQRTYSAFERLPIALALPPGTYMELAVNQQQVRAGEEILERAGVSKGERFAVLNPGANNPAKRWPPDRFAALALHLARRGLRVLINGSPAEAALVAQIAAACEQAKPVQLSGLGITLGSIKALLQRAALLVTNDTGPRHVAAAFGTPLVSLFGPTDYRWTVIPTRPRGPERILLADPTLPLDECANDHPDRCAITKITLESVIEAVDALLNRTPAL